MSDNAATDGGRWRNAGSDDASRGECWGRARLKVLALAIGCGVAPSCNTVVLPGRVIARKRVVECCSFWWWKRSVNVRRWGMSADLRCCCWLY